MTWIDQQSQAKVRAQIATMKKSKGGEAATYYAHAGDDDRFALWLALVDRRTRRGVGAYFSDFPVDWRRKYEAGLSPRRAVHEAMGEAMGIVRREGE